MGRMRILCWVGMALLLAGCITTYRDFPVSKAGVSAPAAKSGSLFYNVKRFDVLDFGGYRTLQQAFAKDSPFEVTEAVSAAPARGAYVEVTTNWKLPATPALVFGYISAVTLTIIPMWSTEDGYALRFDVFFDGVKQKSFNYEITRKFGAWFLLLPVIWINLATYDESEAFRAVTSQFFEDAGAILRSQGATPR